MNDKKTFVLRMDQTMFDALEKWAADEFRSVNGQIEWMIAKQLKDANRWKSVQKLQEKDIITNTEKKAEN